MSRLRFCDIKLKYQVWSSVLGSSLTTVKSNGDKIETKVFAGGAHIATQIADGGEQMLFHTADPVTGTMGTFAGSSSTGVKEEETEPLGQTIDLTNPGTGYPTSYGEVLNKAQDPEWQCVIANARGNELREMPVHCQKKGALEPKYDIVVTFGKSDKEENPQNLSLPTSKDFYKMLSSADRGVTYAANAVRSEALVSTAKADDESTGGCDWDKDGTDDCATTVTYTEESIDMSDTGGADASVSGSFDIPGSRTMSDICDISDIVQPPGVSIAANVKFAEQNYRNARNIAIAGAIIAPIGLSMSAGAAATHAAWFLPEG